MTSASDSTPAQAVPQAPRAPGFLRSLAAHPAFGPLPGLLLIRHGRSRFLLLSAGGSG